MIEEFIASWALFRDTYLAGLEISMLLSLLGVLVVVRDQIFVGAAIAQAATLGVALAIWLGFENAVVFSVGLSVGAALLIGRLGHETPEARTGWIFLFASSASILLLAHSPHGLEEIHRLVTSTIIGATSIDVVVYLVMLSVLALICFLVPRRVLLSAIDPEVAKAMGIRVGAWSLGMAGTLGVSVGLALRTSGLLFTFGNLILPALIAKAVSRRLRTMVWVSPLIALVTALGGFIFANAHDYPPGPVVVALQAIGLAAIWFLRFLLGDKNG